MTEHMIVGTSALSDAYLTSLERFAHELAHDRNGEARKFGQELLAGVRSVLTARALRWSDYVEATGFPGWDACVAALPESVGDAE